MRTHQSSNGHFEKVRGLECLYRYSSNGVYYARLKSHGKEIRQSLKTTDKEIAKRALAKLQGDQAKIDPSAGKITLAALCDRYLPTVQHRAAKTVAQKTYICERIKDEWPGGSNIQVRKVVPSHIETFLAQYDFGAPSYNAYLETIRAMFKMAVRDRILPYSPADDLRERKRKKPIRKTPSIDEFWAIVEEIRNQPFNPDAQDSANFVEFIGLAGLGQAETTSLTWGDIDWRNDQITTYRHKTSHGFVIPIYPQLRPLLERLKDNRTHSPEERVFAIKDAKKAIAGACRRLKLHPYSHRAFRRMFITRAIEKGIDVKVIAEWQGHRDGGKLILGTYSHVNRSHSKHMAALMTDEQPANVITIKAGAA
jgi:integrase